MVSPAGNKVHIDLTPEDRTKLRINPKQTEFGLTELETMRNILSMALPSSQKNADDNWEESTVVDKLGYFVDFGGWGENAKSQAKKSHNEALVSKINDAIAELRPPKK